MLGVGVLRRVGALQRRAATSAIRRSQPLRTAVLSGGTAQQTLLRRTLATTAADDEKPTAIRTATTPVVGARPRILDSAPKTAEEHSASLLELKAFGTANRQTLPEVEREVEEYEPVQLKARNKRESKLFSHIRRLRLKNQRTNFPAPPRPYFPPIRVNHTPKFVHTEEAARKAAAAAKSPVSARLAAFITATANAAADVPAADGSKLLQLTGTAPAPATTEQAPAPATRFAVIDINSKQHKVVEGDLLMVDRMREVSVGDRLQFDRILMVATKTYTVIGRPLIPYAKVKMTCEEHAFTRNMIVFKKHRRKGYRKTKGYRHKVTLLRVDAIEYDAEADNTVEVLPAEAANTTPVVATASSSAPTAAGAAAQHIMPSKPRRLPPSAGAKSSRSAKQSA